METNWIIFILGIIGFGIIGFAIIIAPSEQAQITDAFSKIVTGGGTFTARSYNAVMYMDYPYAQISSADSQTCQNGVATNVTLDTNDEIYKVTHSETVNNNLITIQEKGIYQIIGVSQVGEITNPADGIFNMWIQRNGADLQNTNIKSHVENPATHTQTFTDTLNWIGELNPNDTISFQMSCTDNHIGILATADTAVEPATPSIIINIARIN